ncbi:MAG: hypothetical protein NZ937_08915, partial [Armatimonadetes bacterium]|nr:hypothetical protein [Armatimonadota bacterium]
FIMEKNLSMSILPLRFYGEQNFNGDPLAWIKVGSAALLGIFHLFAYFAEELNDEIFCEDFFGDGS